MQLNTRTIKGTNIPDFAYNASIPQEDRLFRDFFWIEGEDTVRVVEYRNFQNGLYGCYPVGISEPINKLEAFQDVLGSAVVSANNNSWYQRNITWLYGGVLDYSKDAGWHLV